MKLITRNTDYAVRALVFIAKRKEKVVSVSRLVKELNIPRPFLRKILQVLNKKGTLKSYKGQGGGFSLALSPERIMLIDLIKIFQGPLRLNECVFKKRLCANKATCALKKKIDLVEKEVALRIKSINIASLLK